MSLKYTLNMHILSFVFKRPAKLQAGLSKYTRLTHSPVLQLARLHCCSNFLNSTYMKIIEAMRNNHEAKLIFHMSFQGQESCHRQQYIPKNQSDIRCLLSLYSKDF